MTDTVSTLPGNPHAWDALNGQPEQQQSAALLAVAYEMRTATLLAAAVALGSAAMDIRLLDVVKTRLGGALP